MTKPIYVLSLDLGTFDIHEAPGFPGVDFYILVVDFPIGQKHILVLPHQLREALSMIEKDKSLNLQLLYKGFKDPAQDGRFQLDDDLNSYHDLEEFVGPHR